MSWSIQASGHLPDERSNGPEEIQAVKDFAKAVVALAKETPNLGLSYASVNIPNEGSMTLFQSSTDIDVTKDVTEETAVEDEAEEESEED